MADDGIALKSTSHTTIKESDDRGFRLSDSNLESVSFTAEQLAEIVRMLESTPDDQGDF